MEDSAKYLIHASVTASGVVERSDVVGAIFGQTEGLLGDELDLRDLRRSGKVGRIDVEVSSAEGSSRGELTIATNLDKVETATLAASLETITRVGPCLATLEIDEIEDVRAAKRREVVDRATELLRTGFDDSVMSSSEILAEVREHVRVADITEYEGLPAGPRVTESDAIIVVEGRADVLTMLRCGIKNAIAVEGTNVPEAVAELTQHRTVTAFLDGDRGGDLILEELVQVGDVDYVAVAPEGTAVEDLDHHQLFAALQNKVPYDASTDDEQVFESVAATDGSASPAPAGSRAEATTEPALDRAAAENRSPSAPQRVADRADVAATNGADVATTDGADVTTTDGPGGEMTAEPVDRPATTPTEATETDRTAAAGESAADDSVGADPPTTLYGHVAEIVDTGSDRIRLLDGDRETVAEAPAEEADETLERIESAPDAVVLDDILSQRLLDLAADRGVSVIVAAALGQFTKRPTAVRVHAAEEIANSSPGGEGA